jgi:hypothetical protein
MREVGQISFDDNMARGNSGYIAVGVPDTGTYDSNWRPVFKGYADEDMVLFKLACPVAHKR